MMRRYIYKTKRKKEKRDFFLLKNVIMDRPHCPYRYVQIRTDVEIYQKGLGAGGSSTHQAGTVLFQQGDTFRHRCGGVVSVPAFSIRKRTRSVSSCSSMDVKKKQ